MTGPAPTPLPPYYAVIFTSRLRDAADGYAVAAGRMVELSAQSPGFLGIDSTRGADGVGITVCYWRDEASIRAWKQNVEHRRAQQDGKTHWYADYHVRIAKVERAYGSAPELVSSHG